MYSFARLFWSINFLETIYWKVVIASHTSFGCIHCGRYRIADKGFKVLKGSCLLDEYIVHFSLANFAFKLEMEPSHIK